MLLMNPMSRDAPPRLLHIRSSPTLIVAAVALAVFTDTFLYAVIVPVMPFSLVDRIGVPKESVQTWVSISLAVYGASVLVGSPVCGYFADRMQNRRVPMLISFICIAGATAMLCFSRSIAMMLLGRVLQGLSCAMTWTVGLALVIDTVDPQKAGESTGYVSTAMSLGIFSGPMLGGLVYSRSGYYSVFAMCFVLVAVDVILPLVMIEKRAARQWLESNDGANDEDTNDEPGAAQTDGSVIEEVDEERAPGAPLSGKSPTNLLGFLMRPRYLAALWGTLVDSMLQTSFDSTLPLFVSSKFGWHSLGAGLIFLPIILPSFLSPIVGHLSDRYGPKPFATAGFLICTPFLICLRLVTEDSLEHKVMLCGLLAGVGIGTAMALTPVMAEISWAVEGGEEDGTNSDSQPPPYALGYGIYNMAFSGGVMLGPIMSGLIREHAGWKTLTGSLGGLTFLTAIIQWLWIGESWPKKRLMV